MLRSIRQDWLIWTANASNVQFISSLEGGACTSLALRATALAGDGGGPTSLFNDVAPPSFFRTYSIFPWMCEWTRSQTWWIIPWQGTSKMKMKNYKISNFWNHIRLSLMRMCWTNKWWWSIKTILMESMIKLLNMLKWRNKHCEDYLLKETNVRLELFKYDI